MKKEPKKLFMGFYIDSEGEKWFMFVSDGMRKPMDEEFADVVEHETGVRPKMKTIREVYTISEAYDYTGNQNYKLNVSPKKR